MKQNIYKTIFEKLYVMVQKCKNLRNVEKNWLKVCCVLYENKANNTV
jgi:hypothetical protein